MNTKTEESPPSADNLILVAKYLNAKRTLVVNTIMNQFREAHIGQHPLMTDAEITVLQDLLSNTQTYMEYGSGGSTRLAIAHAQTIVSVDNDPRYTKALKAEFTPVTNNTSISINHATLGISGDWGKPLVTFKTDSLRKRIADYASKPWEALKKIDPTLKPDVTSYKRTNLAHAHRHDWR